MRQDQKLKVIKRDNTEEDWSDDKLITSLLKSGLSTESAKEIKLTLCNYLNSLRTRKVASSEIRKEVVKLIENKFPVESTNYTTYIK